MEEEVVVEDEEVVEVVVVKEEATGAEAASAAAEAATSCSDLISAPATPAAVAELQSPALAAAPPRRLASAPGPSRAPPPPVTAAPAASVRVAGAEPALPRATELVLVPQRGSETDRRVEVRLAAGAEVTLCRESKTAAALGHPSLGITHPLISRSGHARLRAQHDGALTVEAIGTNNAIKVVSGGKERVLRRNVEPCSTRLREGDALHLLTNVPLAEEGVYRVERHSSYRTQRRDSWDVM